jgi:hypothetical protein
MEMRYVYFAALIVGATLAGYVARRRGLSERLAELLMTLVAVCGYSTVGLLSVWVTPLQGSDVWLPVLGALHVAIMTGLALAASRYASHDPQLRGVMAVAGGIGNTGFTMGGFVCWILFGDQGLGKTGIYGIMWAFMIVGVTYPLARRFSRTGGPAKPFVRLLIESLLDYRSIGLPMIVLGMLLSAWQVPRPLWVDEYRVVDILTYGTTALAYFAIGLRLHFTSLWPLRRLIAVLAGVRFVLALGVAVVLVYLAGLSPWPLAPVSLWVFLICSFCPTAVTGVAVCNMFNLRPREASVLFASNTALYVAVLLPVVVAMARAFGPAP